jgi:hypothetical protein
LPKINAFTARRIVSENWIEGAATNPDTFDPVPIWLSCVVEFLAAVAGVGRQFVEAGDETACIVNVSS